MRRTLRNLYVVISRLTSRTRKHSRATHRQGDRAIFCWSPDANTASVIHRYIFETESEKVVLYLDIGSIEVTIEPDDFEVLYWMKQTPQTFGPTVDRTRVTIIISLGADILDSESDLQIVSTGL